MVFGGIRKVDIPSVDENKKGYTEEISSDIDDLDLERNSLEAACSIT